MDSIIHFENERYVGRTNFHDGLVSSLVILSVKDVEGVLRMSHFDYRVRRIFNRALAQGVRVKFENGGITITVSIWLKYGYNAADVSYRVQENILNMVSNLIEDKIKHVNVKINGVGKGEPQKVA
jgi:uncharacterized alkaline shock family protein YloU